MGGEWLEVRVRETLPWRRYRYVIGCRLCDKEGRCRHLHHPPPLLLPPQHTHATPSPRDVSLAPGQRPTARITLPFISLSVSLPPPPPPSQLFGSPSLPPSSTTPKCQKPGESRYLGAEARQAQVSRPSQNGCVPPTSCRNGTHSQMLAHRQSL